MIAGGSVAGSPRTPSAMKIRYLTNWKNRKAGETVEVSGSEAVTALRDKAATPVAGKPVDRAERRPKRSAERR